MATHECMRPVLLGVLEAVRTSWDQRDVAETFPRGIRHSRTEQPSVDGFLTREDVGDVAVMRMSGSNDVIGPPRLCVQPPESTLARLIRDVAQHVGVRRCKIISDAH
ncbi:MAG: hypothetical protein RLZZ270_554, partial [Actinomycetota bacterium]